MKSFWASTHHRMVSGDRMLGLTRTLTSQNRDSTSKVRILLCVDCLSPVFLLNPSRSVYWRASKICCGRCRMAQEQTSDAPARLVIHNIGLLLSGDIGNPILDADTVVAVNGKITAVGKAKDLDTTSAAIRIDAKGTTLAPGLIDSHVHPVAGDWTPRQNQIGWIDSYLHGGVTTMISAGEVPIPGRPKSIVGLKAMASTAQRSFAALRPSGVKVLAGAPVIEQGMVEEDFKFLAEAGGKLLGEVGVGSVKDGPTTKQMVAWARKHG